MKVQLVYDRPAQLDTDLLAIVLDSETPLHDLSGSPVEGLVRKTSDNIQQKQLKTDYFTSLDNRGPARNLVVYSTALRPT